MKKILIFDTTLRDGSQGEYVSFTKEDKLKICEMLDDLGLHYIEGGWPGSNPKDMEFFQEARKIEFKNSKLTAFGSTAHPKNKNVKEDKNLQELIRSKAPVITIFGKSWDFHVTQALKIGLNENLRLIEDSVFFLKDNKREVIFDAEHFFDGYCANPEYALKALEAAQKGGADYITLCETNGGMLSHKIFEIVSIVCKFMRVPIGIHCHNDSGCGVANSLEAIRAGAVLVQGTINGLGERCGNANLCSIIPNLKFKMNYNCISSVNIKKITNVARTISELANLSHDERQPYVGNSAFAHKGGIHVSAIEKNSKTYEHIEPELVGNHRRVLISELSGKSNILYKAKNWKYEIEKEGKDLKPILEQIKELENSGFQFESAEASFEILMLKGLGKFEQLFKVIGFRVINERLGDGPTRCEATIKVEVNGKVEHTASDGNGPVNALDNALRKALMKFYPQILNIELTDYKVRVLEGIAGTSAIVRVLIESSDDKNKWGTVGVSENIVKASLDALIDSISFYLMKYADLK
ncbi:citramalate synthase [Candidatus Dependentiae bacterium]|nr:citramalate synthase [Candidatus Dependentiae bacterium]